MPFPLPSPSLVLSVLRFTFSLCLQHLRPSAVKVNILHNRFPILILFLSYTRKLDNQAYEHSKVRVDSGGGEPTSEVLKFVRLASDSCLALRSLWISALSPDGRDGQVCGLWISQVLLPLP